MALGKIKFNCTGLKKQGTVLVLTLLIVTLMTAATLGAAINSYSIIGNAASYNDARVAREAALAGVSDLSKKLAGDPSFDQTMLINFDTGNQASTDSKKAPYIKYYSFTPEEKIKTISRCTNVAVISAWDAAAGSYVQPNDIFTTIGSAMSSSTILKDNGFKDFVNPLAPIDPSTGKVYAKNKIEYWQVLMGGPLDQGNVGVTNTGGVKYSGLFSNPGYLKYDLLILSLPEDSLVLDGQERTNLEDWITGNVDRVGGKLMIDANSDLPNPTEGIINPPFIGDTNYQFKWGPIEKNMDPNTKAIINDELNLSGGKRNDLWVMKNAYNPSDNTPSNVINWEKASVVANGSTQKISGDYYVRQLYKKTTPTVLTFPASELAYDVNIAKSLDTAFMGPDTKVYLKYGQASSFGIGDRVAFLKVMAKYNYYLQLDSHPWPDPLYTTGQEYWKSNFYNFNITVDGVITSIDTAGNFFTVDPDSLYFSQPVHNGGAREVCGKADIIHIIDGTGLTTKPLIFIPDKFDFGGTLEGDRMNFGYGVNFVNFQYDEYFQSHGYSVYVLPKTITGQKEYNKYDLNGNYDISKIKSIWSGGTAVEILPGANQPVPVANISGYTIGSIVQLEPDDINLEPLWGRVNSIDYGPGAAGTMHVDLNFGPTPRSGHGMVYDESENIAYLYGGKDISNRALNGNMAANETYLNRDLRPADDSDDNPLTAIIFNMGVNKKNDLWELSLSGGIPQTWKLIKPANTNINRPLPRSEALVSYSRDNKNLVVAGGNLGNVGDSGMTSIGSTADVWRIDPTIASPQWNLVIDRPVIDVLADGDYLQEVFSHKSINSSSAVNPTTDYWIEPNITPKTTLPANEIHEVTLSMRSSVYAPHGAVGDEVYPDGLTVGDIIRVYGPKDGSGGDTEYVDLKGKISKITRFPDGTDVGFGTYRYQLHFDQPLAGRNTESVADTRRLTLQLSNATTVTPGCDEMTNSANPLGNGNRCLAPGDVATYYGNSPNLEQTDSYDEVYWGRVSEVGVIAGQPVKSIRQLYEGPNYMSNPQGYYVFSEDTLYVFGGYSHMKIQKPSWRLTGVTTASPTWHFLKPKGVSSNVNFNMYHLGGSIQNEAVLVPEGRMNNSVPNDTVKVLKVAQGTIRGIALGMEYLVGPVDDQGTQNQRMKGTVKKIFYDASCFSTNPPGSRGCQKIEFENNLILGGTSEVLANNGLTMFSVNLGSYNSEVLSTSITKDLITDAPATLQLDDSQARGLYAGKQITLGPIISGNNKLFIATVDNIESIADNDHRILLRYQPSYSLTSGDLFTSNGSNKMFVLNTDTSDQSFISWVGEVSQLAGLPDNWRVDWRYVKVDSDPKVDTDPSKKPRTRTAGSLNYASIAGEDFLYLWGGSSSGASLSNKNFLWKLNAKTDGTQQTWELFKNNPDDKLGLDRPISTSGSQSISIDQTAGNLLFYSGDYSYAYERSDQNPKVDLADIPPIGSPPPNEYGFDVWSNSPGNTDGSSVEFSHPIFASLYDRNGLYPIFRLNSARLRDVLKIGEPGYVTGGYMGYGLNAYAITDLGLKFDVLATYPCQSKPGWKLRKLPYYNEDNEKVETRTDHDGNARQVCDLANMAVASVDDKGGFLFISSRSLAGASGLSSQIEYLDLMNSAFSKGVPPGYDPDDSSTWGDGDYWKEWLNGLAIKRGFGNALIDDLVEITIDIDDLASPFNKYWEQEFHYYKPPSPPWTVWYATPNNLATQQFIRQYHPGTLDYVRNAVFYLNLIAYTQSLNKMKVTGYYGGISRAFIVSYLPTGTITSVVEVPAEE
ncbi:MAG: hypothetical protein Q7S37_04825 [bacterium]|nr:hypothetical protein [bacterium]